MRFCTGLVLGLSISLSLLAACGKAEKDSQSEVQEVEEKASTKFNFARYVRENPKMENLKRLVGPSDAYLSFGERSKFSAETNFIVESTSDKGFFGGQRSILATYWIDSFVFGRRIGGKDRGSILDLGAVADLASTTIEAHVRFMGQDKYKGQLGKAFDESFTRDLNLETVYYPVPLLGLKVGGNVGGELGLKAELGFRKDNMMSLLFLPKTAITAGLGGGVTALAFATAKIEGLVRLLELKLAATANLGYMRDRGFSYGHIGIDGGELNAIDGAVKILARASMDGILPGGIDKALWKFILKTAGIEKSEWEWEHTVWDPAPVFETDVPAYTSSFAKMGKEPRDLFDCKAAIAEVDAKLGVHMSQLEAYSTELKDIEADMAKSSLQNLGEIRAKNQEYCKGW